VKLRSVMTGGRYALPGEGKEPDCEIRARVFQIEDIVGRQIVKLTGSPGGGYSHQAGGLTEAIVSAITDSEGGIRTLGELGTVADELGFVHVCFGEEPLREKFQDMPCGSLEGVSTPATPPFTVSP